MAAPEIPSHPHGKGELGRAALPADHRRQVRPDPILRAWAEHLERLVERRRQAGEESGPGQPGLLPETAGNYRRIAQGFVDWLAGRQEASGRGWREEFLRDPQGALAGYIGHIEKIFSRQYLITVRSALRGFIAWAKEHAAEFPRGEDAADPGAAPPLSAARPQPVFLPVSRRLILSGPVERLMPVRDALLTLLVRERIASFGAAAALRWGDVDSPEQQPALRIGGNKTALPPQAASLLKDYLAALRESSLKRLLDDSQTPLFLSCDGGSLTVDEDLEGLSGRDSLRQARFLGNQLLQAMIIEGAADFAALRRMRMTDLRRVELKDPALLRLRSDYVQIVRLSRVMNGAALSPHGPGIAFPAADGGMLTGDPF